MIKVFLYGAITCAIFYGIFFLFNLPRIIGEQRYGNGWARKNYCPDRNAHIESITLERLERTGLAAQQRYSVLFSDGYCYSTQMQTKCAVNVTIDPQNYTRYISPDFYHVLIRDAKYAHQVAVQNAATAPRPAANAAAEEKPEGAMVCGMPEEEYNKLPAYGL